MSGQSQEGSLQSVLRWTCGVIFLDTPHYGTTLAKWVVPVSSKGFIKRNSKILQALRPGSEILDHIRDSFLRIVMARNRDGHRPLDITCFHAELSPQGADTVKSLPCLPIAFLHTDTLNSRSYLGSRRF